MLAGTARAADTDPMKTLFDFKTPADARAWQVVNDDVMGGVSRSRFTVATNGPATFAGELSLENNGGFASVRSPSTSRDLSGQDAFVIRVRGDGKRYKFTARTDSGFDSVLYQASFDTKPGEWTEHRIAFDDLKPTFRGRVLTNVAKFTPARFQSAGFLISDGQAGAFSLEIAWIKTAPAAK
jgi:monofunctional biosynthetic peptidoglycan transglycosylase